MVCEDLTKTGVLGFPEEWFLSWNPKADEDWQSKLEAARKRGTTPNGFFAVKLMANQLTRVDQCLSTFISSEFKGGPYPYLRTALADAAYIWVRRRDTVGQAISHYLARTTGVYHVVNDPNDFMPGSAVIAKAAEEKLKDAPYDFQAIMREWYQNKRDDLVWEQFFQACGIEPLVVWYEEYSSTVLQSIAAAAGANASLDSESRNLVKMPSRRNDEMRRQFLADLFSKA
jgi:LPS sulfotransferase NodH